MSSFIKQYVSQNTTLHEFISQIEGGDARQKYLELKADHETSNAKPKLMTTLLMEKQMSELYTRKIFYKFQTELMLIISSTAEITDKN